MSSRRNSMGDPFARERRDDMTLEQIDRELFGALKNAEGPTVLALDVLRLDGGTQPREKLDETTISEYAEAMERGDEFPPLTVFYDGEAYWLADGFHRYHAAKVTGQNEIACDVRQGTRRDAVLYSVGVNAEHGLRRTNADKRRAVMTLLRDPEWGKWSDREIARKCKVSQPFVSKLRRELSDNGYQMERTVRRGDTVYTMRTDGISEAARERGKQKRAEEVEHPYVRSMVIEMLQEARGWMEFEKLVRVLGEQKNIRAESAEATLREMAGRDEIALMGVDEEIWVTLPEEAQKVEQERRQQGASRVRYVGGEFNQDAGDEAVYGVPVVEEEEENADKAWTALVEMYRGWIEEFLRGRSASYKELYEAIVGKNTEQDQHFAFDAALKALDTGGVVVCNGGDYVLAEEQQGKHPAETIPGYQQMVEAHFGSETPPKPSAGLYSAQRLERLLGHVNGAIYKLVEHVRDMEKQGHGVPDEMRERVLAVMRGTEQRAYDGEWLPYALGAIEQMLGIGESDGE